MIRLGLNALSETDSQPHFALRFPSHVAGGSGIDWDGITQKLAYCNSGKETLDTDQSTRIGHFS